MKVCEIFESIQGEGRYMGLPCLFIRVYGCNWKCETCDTKYSWRGEYRKFSVKELVEIIENSSKRGVVFTGGEPLLYTSEIIRVVEGLEDYTKIFLLETNGIILNEVIPAYFDCVTLSPKKNYPKVSEAIEWWSVYNNVDYKFVIGSQSWCWSLSDVKKVVREIGLDEDRVWLMPHGSTQQELDKISKKVWEFCVRNNFNYSDRLHIRVWNGTKGR